MKNRNYWPLLFIGIFTFTFSMIVWTIISAVNTPVHEDKSFLNSYQNIDEQYNNIVVSNKAFNEKYYIDIKLNSSNFGLDINDIFLAQRVLEEKPTHKDFFLVGENRINFLIKSLDSNEIVEAKINFKVTRATNSNSDIDISNKENKDSSFTFDLKSGGNWNITGTVETLDKNKGYFYIKSNAITR